MLRSSDKYNYIKQINSGEKLFKREIIHKPEGEKMYIRKHKVTDAVLGKDTPGPCYHAIHNDLNRKMHSWLTLRLNAFATARQICSHTSLCHSGDSLNHLISVACASSWGRYDVQMHQYAHMSWHFWRFWWKCIVQYNSGITVEQLFSDVNGLNQLSTCSCRI